MFFFLEIVFSKIEYIQKNLKMKKKNINNKNITWWKKKQKITQKPYYVPCSQETQSCSVVLIKSNSNFDTDKLFKT